MMRITIAINDRTIGDIGVHRKQRRRDPLGYVGYDVYDLRDDPKTLDDAEKICEVIHDPTDGAMELVNIVSRQLDDHNLDSR